MRRVARFLILTGVSTLAACASQAPVTSSGAGGAQTAKAIPTAATSTTVHPGADGYRREVVNGYEMFCRNDTDTGSRVQRTKVCLTWDELQAQERNNMAAPAPGSTPLD